LFPHPGGIQTKLDCPEKRAGVKFRILSVSGSNDSMLAMLRAKRML